MKSAICLLAALILSSQIAISYQQSCKALVFDAGGDEGAYQAGVFQGLANTLPASELQYDIITGVGVGAINAAFIGQFQIGNELQAATELALLWTTLTQNQIYQAWPGGILQGLLFEPAIYDSSPLLNTLQRYITTTLKRSVNVGTVDVNTQEFVSFQADSLNLNDLIQVLMASTAQPMFLPYQSFGNSTYFSGNVINAFDLVTAIDRCLDIVGNDTSAITIDLIFTANSTLNPWTVDPDDKVLDSYIREQKIVDADNTMRQYSEARALYPNINWRYQIWPSTPLLDSSFPFLFYQINTLAMIAQGYNDAVHAVQEAQNGRADILEQEAIGKQLRKLGLPVTDEWKAKYKAAISKRDAKMREVLNL